MEDAPQSGRKRLILAQPIARIGTDLPDVEAQLFEETQRAIVTLRRLLADIQQNPAKYVGEVQLFE